MRGPWGEAKKRRLLKAPLPKLPPPPIWGMGGDWGGGEEMLHGVNVVVHEGGVEVYDLAGTNAPKSCCEQLRKGRVGFTLHTSPPHCNKKNCVRIAVRVRVLLNVRPTLPWGGVGGWVWQNFRVGGCPTPPPPGVGWDFVGALGLLSQCHFFLSSVAGSP